jgi:hypothetical protein
MKRVKFTVALGKLLRWAWAHNIHVGIDWVKRDVEVQARLVNEGKSWTMKSKHLKGQAADLLIFNDDGTFVTDGNDERYEQLGEQWERLGGKWGGRWKKKDSVHFQWS